MLKHRYSKWNDLMTDKPYHKKPTGGDIKALLNSWAKNKGGKNILRREKDIMILVNDTLIEIVATVGNSFAYNRYSDVWAIENKEVSK